MRKSPPPRDVCRNKQTPHKLTPLNIVIEHVHGRTIRRCLECRLASTTAYVRRHHQARARETCWAGKHPWNDDNIVYDGGHGRCRGCKREWARAHYSKHKIILCVAKGCRRGTTRTTGGTYICPRHRENPPPWIEASGQRIVGTQVVKSTIRIAA
jgi:hypothetical protein